MGVRDILGSAVLHAGLALAVLAMPSVRAISTPRIYEVSLAVCAPRVATLPGKGTPGGSVPPAVSPPPPEAAKPSAAPAVASKPEKTVPARRAAAKSVRPPQPSAPAQSVAVSMPMQAVGTGDASNSPAATGLPAGGGPAAAPAKGSATYGADAVDERPSVLRRVEPDYPDQARRRHEEGTVLVRLIVDTQGQPKDCAVLMSEPVGLFDAAALEAVQRFRFRPGKLAGRAVATVVHIPFAFKLQ